MAKYSRRELQLADVKTAFSLIDGKIHRRNKCAGWYPVNIKLDKMGRCGLKLKGGTIPHTRVLYMLVHDRDIPKNMHIDHIDKDPWNNDIDNLQELSPRDNLSKEKKYNPKARRGGLVVFNMQGSDAKQISFHIGIYPDDDLREYIWHTLAPLFLFRQELKGNQQARERLIEMVELGDIVAAKTLVKAYALAHGVTMK